MPTVSINLVWTKVVDAAQADFLIKWGTAGVAVQVAVMGTTATPDAYAGSLYTRDDVVTRASIGAGHVWIRLINSVTSGSIQVQVENSPVAKAALFALARRAWLARVAILKAENPIVSNLGWLGANAIRFVNPEHTFNGDGTSPVAATGAGLPGAFNVIPSHAATTTYLLCEGTTHGPQEMAQNGTLLATYGRNSTATRIERVTDPARVATIDAAGGLWGVRSVANRASWGLSGIRVTNVAGSSCDAVQLGAQTINTASANCFAEYVYVDNVTGVAGNGAGIISRGTEPIIRFCTVRIKEGEPIYCSDNGTGAPGDNPQVYGNDVEITALTGDGPDGIQVLNLQASALSTSIRIEANWVNVSHQNCKYGIIATHTPTPASCLIAHNVIQCADVSVMPYVTGAPTAGNNQNGIYCSVITSVARGVRIVGNILEGGEYSIRYVPASAGGSCEVRGNLCWFSGSGTPAWYSPLGIYLTNNVTVASRVEHNTVVMENATDAATVTRGILTVANGAVHQFNANIVVGPWTYGIQKGSATTESYNVVFGALTHNYANSANASAAPGTGSVVADPELLVGSFYPASLAPSVPASIYALPVDGFGNPYTGLPGAVQ